MDAFAAVREGPGDVSVKTIEREVFKLIAICKIGPRMAWSSTAELG